MNRYTGINRDATLEGKRYIQNAIYPDIPNSAEDIYVMTTEIGRASCRERV